MSKPTRTVPAQQAVRAIVISDLHLGGSPPYMMSRPDRLASFLDSLPAKLRHDETLELVIAGDFIDFLAIPNQASWTPDPVEARDKLNRTMADSSPFAPVFKSLRALVAAGHRLTILIGNHDVEMALPSVQDAFLAKLVASQHQVLFVDDGRAYRIGRALIEHGNRYDGANVNDWTNLRAIVSALSRFEVPKNEIEISAGSKIVEKVINTIKPQYPFVDLLQPQGELVALLLVAFEPGLIWHIDKLARMLHGKLRQDSNRDGRQPGQTRHVGYEPLGNPDAELKIVFGSLYEILRLPPHEPQPVGLGDLISTAWAGRQDSLASILARGESLPTERLRQIRLCMQRMHLDDSSSRIDGPTEQYGAAAERLVLSSKGEVESVIMGHTHLARHIGDKNRGTYINTGTWADVIRMPPEAVSSDDSLQSFLYALYENKLRNSPCTYGDLRVESDGRVTQSKLARADR